jgi:hypothetical protein
MIPRPPDIRPDQKNTPGDRTGAMFKKRNWARRDSNPHAPLGPTDSKSTPVECTEIHRGATPRFPRGLSCIDGQGNAPSRRQLGGMRRVRRQIGGGKTAYHRDRIKRDLRAAVPGPVRGTWVRSSGRGGRTGRRTTAGLLPRDCSSPPPAGVQQLPQFEPRPVKPAPYRPDWNGEYVGDFVVP